MNQETLLNQELLPNLTIRVRLNELELITKTHQVDFGDIVIILEKHNARILKLEEVSTMTKTAKKVSKKKVSKKKVSKK